LFDDQLARYHLFDPFGKCGWAILIIGFSRRLLFRLRKPRPVGVVRDDGSALKFCVSEYWSNGELARQKYGGLEYWEKKERL
jgi:hypothetical protein